MAYGKYSENSANIKAFKHNADLNDNKLSLYSAREGRTPLHKLRELKKSKRLYDFASKMKDFAFFIAFAAILCLPILVSAGSDSTVTESPTPSGSREVMRGREFVKINLAELYMICRGFIGTHIDSLYVVVGKVDNHPMLKPKGQFGLYRVLVTCCALDAAAIGFRVQSDSTRNYPEGTWLKIFGRLQKVEPDGISKRIKLRDAPLTSFQDKYILAPESLEVIDKPRNPDIKSYKLKEPYAN
jgi:hypothetical protein